MMPRADDAPPTTTEAPERPARPAAPATLRELVQVAEETGERLDAVLADLCFNRDTNNGSGT